MGRRAYYTVKLTSPADGWGRLPELTARARTASEALRAEGADVRFVRSVFVPEDGACFYLFEAASADVVREAARRAGMGVDHLVEPVASPESGAADITPTRASR